MLQLNNKKRKEQSQINKDLLAFTAELQSSMPLENSLYETKADRLNECIDINKNFSQKVII